MDLTELLRARRMVRSFQDRPLAPGVADGVLASALRAPTAGHTQAVDLVALEGPGQTARYWDASLPAGDRAGFAWPGLLRAPLLVVVVSSEAAYRRRYDEPDKAAGVLDVPWWHVDAAFAAMVLLLGAVDAGLGALFFRTHRPEAVCAALGVPTEYAPVGTVAMGHPAPDRPSSSAVRPTRSAADRIHRGAW